MAAKTTSGAGSYTDGTKWSGGVAPVDASDTLTINHVMTWAPAAGSSFTIGTGSGTALTFGTGGSLTITPQGAFTLTLAGTTSGGNITTRELVVNATNGAVTINVDATGAGAGFALVAGGNYSVTNAGGWNLNGNSTYGITLASLPSDGSKRSYFTNGGTGGGGNIAATYTTFRRIGSSSQAGFAPTLDNRLRSLTWTDVTLDDCGQVTLSGDASYTGTIAFTRVISTNSATNGTTSWPLQYGMSATPTAAFNGCVWDKKIKIIASRGFGGDGCYLHNGWEGTTGAYHGGTLTNSFVRQTFDSLITAFNVTNSFRYWDATGGSNPHWDSINGSAPSGTAPTHTGNAYYFNGTDASGNVITCSSSNNVDVVASNNIVLPNAAGASSGTFMTSNGSVGAGFSITCEHNTLFVKGTHGFELGHLYTSLESPSRYASIKSNLFIGGTTGYKTLDVDPTLYTDVSPVTATNYNGSYQIKTTAGTAGFTNEGRGYAGKWSATPGANDVDGVDPAFVNGSASLASWSTSIGGAGTDEAARAAIQADPSLAADLMAYLAAAYRPTAAAYNGAAHDGGTIGAFAYQAPASGGSDGVLLAPGVAITSGDILIL